MLESRVITCAVACETVALYELLWRPESFLRWAAGLAAGGLGWEGEAWRAQGPDGPVRIRFTPHNAYGVMDHWVELGDGSTVFVPMRIVANQAGSEVMLTLFRQPAMTDVKWDEDQAWVRRDLAALKAYAEATDPA